MSTEWEEVTLESLGRIVTGKTPPTSVAEYYGGNIPFITPSDFDGRRYIDKTGRLLTNGGAKVVSGSLIPKNSVMVSCIGSDMGKSALSVKESVTNQQINSIIVNAENDPLFIYYNLSHRKDEIRASASGSAQPILNKSSFGRMAIRRPSLKVQTAIAHILGTLDDKIELNRKMNETLESMARALFKSWFIDFDPVRAKMDGRWKKGQSLPGLPAELWDLFPGQLTGSLEVVPDGWTESPLADLCDLPYGKNLPTSDLMDSGYPVYGAGGVIGYYNRSLFKDPTILITCRGNGCGFIHETREEAFVTNNSIAILPKTKSLSRHFLRHRLLTIDRSPVVTGSAQPQITVTNLSTLRLLVPSSEAILEAFHQSVDPLWQKCLANDIESTSLGYIRDALLPRLISSGLTVRGNQ